MIQRLKIQTEKESKVLIPLPVVEQIMFIFLYRSPQNVEISRSVESLWGLTGINLTSHGLNLTLLKIIYFTSSGENSTGFNVIR